jgi:hypothetical protein
VAFAVIEASEDFGRRWKAWRKRLGLPDASAITVLADGASHKALRLATRLSKPPCRACAPIWPIISTT